jgi:hypothetical protein
MMEPSAMRALSIEILALFGVDHAGRVPLARFVKRRAARTTRAIADRLPAAGHRVSMS